MGLLLTKGAYLPTVNLTVSDINRINPVKIKSQFNSPNVTQMFDNELESEDDELIIAQDEEVILAD